MKLFEDQPLGSHPHIAIFSSTKVGNFVVTTPLLRGLKEKYPTATVDFFGSDVTRAFEEACPYIDYRFSLDGEKSRFRESFEGVVEARTGDAGPYDLAINCDEFAELNVVAATVVQPRFIAGGGVGSILPDPRPSVTSARHRIVLEDDWNSPAFLARYTDVLDSNYIAEIFCRIAYVETDYFALEVSSAPPDFAVPDVLIHVTTTRSAKMWPIVHWLQLVDALERRGSSVGLIGCSPSEQRKRYNAGDAEDLLLERTGLIDLRGRTPLLELAGALELAHALVTVDAGPLHVAAAVGCPTVALFGADAHGVGASPVHLWAPRVPHVRVTRSEATCHVCGDARFKNSECLVAGQPCMTGVTPARVNQLVQELLEQSV